MATMDFCGCTMPPTGPGRPRQVTIANANHFLKSLAQSGFASVQTTKRPLGKGRPSAVYRLEL